MRRSNLPVLSTETCMTIPTVGVEPILRVVVRKARLELARVSPPDPKSGASTNSATFASAAPKYNAGARPAGYARRSSGFAFAHQHPGHLAQPRQAFFQHEIKR